VGDHPRRPKVRQPPGSITSPNALSDCFLSVLRKKRERAFSIFFDRAFSYWHALSDRMNYRNPFVQTNIARRSNLTVNFGPQMCTQMFSRREECYKAHAGPSQRARTISDVWEIAPATPISRHRPAGLRPRTGSSGPTSWSNRSRHGLLIVCLVGWAVFNINTGATTGWRCPRGYRAILSAEQSRRCKPIAPAHPCEYEARNDAAKCIKPIIR